MQILKLFQCNWNYNKYGKTSKWMRKPPELTWASSTILMFNRVIKHRITTENKQNRGKIANRNPLITQRSRAYRSVKLPYFFFDIFIQLNRNSCKNRIVKISCIRWFPICCIVNLNKIFIINNK